jgi:hypothetical protein
MTGSPCIDVGENSFISSESEDRRGARRVFINAASKYINGSS